jgi:hypothetical protein
MFQRKKKVEIAIFRPHILACHQYVEGIYICFLLLLIAKFDLIFLWMIA